MADITTAVTTALTTMQTDLMGLIGNVLPAALSIVGVSLVVVLGIKLFKRVASK